MIPKIVSRPLSIPAVAAAAMRGEADPRYEKRPAGQGEWKARADAVKASVSPSWMRELAPALGASGEAAARLDRTAAGNGLVVTTGQQPGLFGGPVYTLSKALSALALANALEKVIGVPVAPVFWAATDDADFREASKTAVAVRGGARELVMEPAAPVGLPMSKMPLGDVHALVRELESASGSGVDAEFVSTVEKAYVQSQTVGGAYVALLRSIFAPLGIAVLDASHEAVRSASAPLIKSALERGDEIAAALAAGNKEIEKEGHSLQVQDVAGLSLVFENTAAGRKRIPRKRGVGGLRPDADLGPNVLLRPIVERSILPTIAYVGGPAEIAYFAQLAPVARTLNLPRPLIVPRWSCTLIEPHIQEILSRLGLDADDLEDPHAAETRIAKRKVPQALQHELHAFRAAIDEHSSSLGRATAIDEALVAKTVADGLRQNLLHRLERFERRLVAASKRRHANVMRDIATARGSLFPLGRPQERTLSFIPFLTRYGKALVSGLTEEASRHAKTLL